MVDEAAPRHADLGRYFPEEVWRFTRSCESLMAVAKHLSTLERDFILEYMDDLKDYLRHVEPARKPSHAGNHR